MYAAIGFVFQVLAITVGVPSAFAFAMLITVEIVLKVLAILVGVPAAIALLINILKWAGVVNDGTSGKWSAALNLIAIIGIAILLQFFPKVDVVGLDAQLLEVVKFGALIFEYVIQIAGTKVAHLGMTKVLRITSFSHTLRSAAG